jgi:hypothetical protein
MVWNGGDLTSAGRGLTAKFNSQVVVLNEVGRTCGMNERE